MPGWASWLLAAPQTICGLQRRHRLVGQRAAERARRVDVHRLVEQLVGVDRVDLGMHDAAPGRPRRARRRPRRSRRRPRAGARRGGARPCRRRRSRPGGPAASASPRRPRRGPHALEDAVRREDRGVAGAAVGRGPAGDERALPRDDVHVLDVGADVAGGVVAAADSLDEPAVGPQQRLGLVGRRVADDDGLAAAEVEPGARRLVGHRAGQVEHVGERVLPRSAYG